MKARWLTMFLPAIGLLAIVATSAYLRQPFVDSSIRAEEDLDALLRNLERKGQACVDAAAADRVRQEIVSVTSYVRNTREALAKSSNPLMEAISVYAVLWILVCLAQLRHRRDGTK